jgi:hypothetical protein
MIHQVKAVDGGSGDFLFAEHVDQTWAIAHKQKWFTGMEVDPETEIIVSAGGTGAVPVYVRLSPPPCSESSSDSHILVERPSPAARVPAGT